MLHKPHLSSRNRRLLRLCRRQARSALSLSDLVTKNKNSKIKTKNMHAEYVDFWLLVFWMCNSSTTGLLLLQCNVQWGSYTNICCITCYFAIEITHKLWVQAVAKHNVMAAFYSWFRFPDWMDFSPTWVHTPDTVNLSNWKLWCNACTVVLSKYESRLASMISRDFWG